MKIRILPSVFCLSALLAAGCTSGSKGTKEEQPNIGTRTVKLLEQGELKFTTPISQQAVEGNKEDVPGYDEGPAYALFKFGEGLSY